LVDIKGNIKYVKEGEMLVWCMTLFGLGILAFLDTFFNYGDIFRRVNSVLFMLLSLGLLIRTYMMIKTQTKEKLISRNNELEKQVTHTGRPTRQEEAELVH
jgi:hypothetical protein